MPRMNGKEALKAIRRDPDLRLTPIVVLSTSSATSDVQQAYDLGANTFFTKSSSFDGLVAIARALYVYWGTLASVPERTQVA